MFLQRSNFYKPSEDVKIDHNTAKAIISYVILNGPWKEFYACAGVNVKIVDNEEDANIIIKWDELTPELTLTPNEKIKLTPINAQTQFLCYAIPGYSISIWIPKIIILNKDMTFYVSFDKNISIVSQRFL